MSAAGNKANRFSSAGMQGLSMEDSVQPTDQVAGDNVLVSRLESLEQELGRLTNFLAEQSQTRQKRRRRITIRVILIAVALFAGLFAWFSAVYRSSRAQAAAVDSLINEGAFVMYEPRESIAVSLLPGTPQQPPRVIARSLGVDFFRSVSNVSTRVYTSKGIDKKKVLPAIASLKGLRRLRLSGLTLTTADLNAISGLSNLESLDLNRTRLDNGSLPWLADTQLRWFDISHTWLGDRALHDLSRCPDLQHLNLERSTVTDKGLQHLYGMKSLRYINLLRCPVSLAAVQQLSNALPACTIDYEPLVILPSGKVSARASQRGRVRFGGNVQVDPRESKRAVPPADQQNVAYPQLFGAQPVSPYGSRTGFIANIPALQTPRRASYRQRQSQAATPVTIRFDTTVSN